MNTKQQGRSTERGIGYVLVLFMAFLVGALCMGLMQEGLAARTALKHHVSNMRALELAETGVVRAEMELRSMIDSGSDGVGVSSGALGAGAYDVTIASDPVSDARFILTAVGRHALSTRRIEVGIRRRLNSNYADALFSLEDLTVSSISTDAYDSRNGTYASQATMLDGGGTFAEEGGNLGSNGDIYLDGTSVWVRGDTIPGPLRDVYESGSPTVTGDQAPREYELDFPPAPYEDFFSAMTSNSNALMGTTNQGNSVRYNTARMSLDVTGNANVVMPAGTYFFKSINIRGGSTLTVEGPVKIYVTDSLEIGAGANIIADRPSDVQIFAHPYPIPDNSAPAEATVKVSGGSNVTWALYAPGAALDIGGGNHFYGAAAAKRIELNGSNSFHYDKALGEFGSRGAAIIERLYWKEAPLPRP